MKHHMKHQNGAPDKCLNPHCARTVRARGLCDICYQTAYMHVRLGKTSWDALQKAGKLLPKKQRASSKSSEWLFSK